ncbi:MAG TPA: alanine racemase [Candidatus Dormibacteraeota bacterium]|jgi:alanine racemase|nr:alanine racemase [Candidatus Dormibacteraeota bacterium]
MTSRTHGDDLPAGVRATKWAEVDLAALRDNTAALRGWVGEGCAVMAMVKANGYGHGALHAATAALAGGASWLGVSSITEALELRRAGIEARILNCGWTMPVEMAAACASGIDIAVFTPTDVAAARHAAGVARIPLRAHWKIDTGMGRLGTRLDDVAPMRDALLSSRGDVEVTGLFTHFASADDASVDFTLTQHERFLAAVTPLRERFPDALLHCANSAAALRLRETHHDLIRPGIALFGYPPQQWAGVVDVRPALRVRALVTMVKDVEPGDSVGYGREWIAARRTRVATVAAGYADGVDRRNGNRGAVIAGGVVCPMIGRISMDQLSVDVSETAGVEAGDPVTLIGADGGHSLDAAAVAERIGTISYEVLCAVSLRVPRIPVDAIGG